MSLRKAINDHCKWCIYDRLAQGNWRQQVDGCSITRCHLYPVRPRSSAPLAGKADSGAETALPQTDHQEP